MLPQAAGGHCNGVPPGPGNAVIGVPSATLPEIMLFLNDWTAPLPVLLTPVTLPNTVDPPRKAMALPLPLAAAPVRVDAGAGHWR